MSLTITLTDSGRVQRIRGHKTTLERLASYASAARAHRSPVSTKSPTEQRLTDLAQLIGQYWLDEQFKRVK